MRPHERQERLLVRTDSECDRQEEEEGEEEEVEKDSSSAPSEDDDFLVDKGRGDGGTPREVSFSARSTSGTSATRRKRKSRVLCLDIRKGQKPRSTIACEIWAFLENDLSLADYQVRRDQTSGQR